VCGKRALDLLEGGGEIVQVGQLGQSLAADLIEPLVIDDAAGYGT
jgi:hypothetical protein